MMAKIVLMRQDFAMPDESALEQARRLIFGVFDGFTADDKRSWRRFWTRLMKMEPGELAQTEMVFPRSGPFHRRHMALEQHVFDAQERFDSFQQFRNWLKVGAGHCAWVPGPRGAVVPIPDSTSYTSMDDEVFRKFHLDSVAFLRSVHAPKVLWPHLSEQDRADMIAEILEGFGE